MPEGGAPLVTVIVPVYGVEAYVEECLRSILDQSHTALQVVVVDDGSTDGSVAIVERIAALDGRVELHRYPNGGLGRARNRGLTHARGEYVTFVDSDDVLPARAVSTLVGSLEQTGSDFATGSVERLAGQVRRRSPQHQPALSQRVLRTTLVAKPDLVYSTTSCNSLFRLSFWKRAGLRFAHDRFYEDMETTAHATVRAASIDVVGAVTYLWRLRDDGSSITQRRAEVRNLADRVVALEASRRWFATAGPDVLRAFDTKVAVMDLPIYAPAMVDAAAATRTLLRRQCRTAVARIGGSDALDALPVRARVLHALIARRSWSALPAVVEFFRAHGADLPLDAVHEGEGTLRLPSRWEGTRVPRLSPRTRRVHGDEVALQVVLERVGWSGGALEVAGRARLRHVPADDVRVVLSLVAGTGRVDFRTTVEQGADGAAFTATIDRDELVAAGARKWVVEARVTAAGGERVGPVVVGGLRGGLAVVVADVGVDGHVVAPLVERGKSLRIEVREPAFWVKEAAVAGRTVDVVVAAASESDVQTAVLALPGAGREVEATVERLGDGLLRVRGDIPAGVWPADGPRRAFWRVLLRDTAGRGQQPAVPREAVLVTGETDLTPVATRQGWFSVLDDPYRFAVTAAEATDRGLAVRGTAAMAGERMLVLRSSSGEVLSSADVVDPTSVAMLPWPVPRREAVLEVVHAAGSDAVIFEDGVAESLPSDSPDGLYRIARRRADGIVVRPIGS